MKLYHRSKINTILSLLIVAFLIFNFGCQKAEKSQEIVLGAIMPLTGDAAAYGKNCKQGIELAVSEVNAKGVIKGDKIKVIFEDSQLQPRVAVSVFQKLVSVDKVVAVLGPLASSCAMATAPLANQNKIVSFSPGASTPKLTDAGPYVFRDWQSDALEAVVMAKYALKKGWTKFAVFYVNNDFGIALKNYFTKTVEKDVGKILLTESFEQGQTNFKSEITKIKSANPDAIYLLSYPQQTPNIINQMKALNVKAQILGVAAMEDPSLIKIAGKNAEGIQYTIAIPASKDNSIRKNFIENYHKKFGENPGLISDTGYDAVYILAKTIENSKRLNGESIQKSLSEIKHYNGASGKMTFDENGDVIKPIGIKEIKDGQFIWVNNNI